MNETEYKASELTDLGNVIISRLEGSGKPSFRVVWFVFFTLKHISVQGS